MPASQAPRPSRRHAHPAAVAVLFVGLAALAVGLIRVAWTRHSSTPVQPVSARAAQREPGPMRIVVTIPPLLWPVKALAPPDAEITLLTPPGSGCEGIELAPTQAAAIRRADLIVRVGMGLDEPVLHAATRRSAPDQRNLALAELVRPAGGSPVEAPAPAPRDHEHPEADPHFWLDPLRMESGIAAIRDAIFDWQRSEYERFAQTAIGSEPALHEPLIMVEAEKADRLMKICRALGQEYQQRLAHAPSRVIVTQHDAWSYLAERYNIDVAAVIQHAHGAEPGPAELADLSRIVREKRVKAIFIEPQLNPALARRLADVTGARILTLDPLGDGDWPALMRTNLDALAEGLSAK
jgi:ABC-type Zn uptake system ZnuABC Zn-binding protein ZnuA